MDKCTSTQQSCTDLYVLKKQIIPQILTLLYFFKKVAISHLEVESFCWNGKLSPFMILVVNFEKGCIIWLYKVVTSPCHAHQVFEDVSKCYRKLTCTVCIFWVFQDFISFKALDVGLKNYKMRSFIHFQCYNVVILTIYVFKNKSTKRICCVLFFTKSLYLQALL